MKKKKGIFRRYEKYFLYSIILVLLLYNIAPHETDRFVGTIFLFFVAFSGIRLMLRGKIF